jgi:hypothetical protein
MARKKQAMRRLGAQLYGTRVLTGIVSGSMLNSRLIEWS